MPTSQPAPRLTSTQWLICTIAVIGFAFDIYEILMLPLIVRPALLELTGAAPGSPEFQMWVGRLFYIPAFAGGIFGLLGGYLTDRLGRRRVLTYSILIYAVAAFLSGYATSIEMLLVLRCFVFVGVCVEFVAAIAWLAELFPEPKQREKVLGYTQAFSSLGGLLVAFANGLAIEYAHSLPALGLEGIADPHALWRYTVMSGVIPAIPLIFIRPFLPESPVVAAEEGRRHAEAPEHRGALRARAAQDDDRDDADVRDVVRRGVRRHSADSRRSCPGLPEVRQMVQGLAPPQARLTEQRVASDVTKVQEVGGLVGRVALAFLALVIVSRRRLIRMFQIPGLIVMPIVFAWIATTSLSWLYVGVFLAGFCTVAQFSFWGNYLPRVYPMHLRGTGESFAANIGGRLIGTSFAWVTATLAITPDRAYAPTKVALVAAGIGFSVYLVGLIASFFLPEPPPDNLPD